jgi:hypothetical protein
MSGSALPDPRRHAFRADLAAASLRGHVAAPRYAEGEPRQVMAPVLPLRQEPRFDARLETEALMGERVTVYDIAEGWAWAQLDRDGYVGYLPAEGLTPKLTAPNHKVTALRTFVFSRPGAKSPPLALISLNARLTAARAEGNFLALCEGGFVFARHVAPVGKNATDYVAVAESFLGAPYLWGGRTSIGLDCSGLVQLALEAAGIPCPRDADMQAAELGAPIDWQGKDGLARSDLVFWEGHVGIMTGAETLLHANAYHMAVECEPLLVARGRIAANLSREITTVRRLPGLSAG